MPQRDPDPIPLDQLSEGDRVTIRWSSMSGGTGEVTGRITRVRRGGVADDDGVQQFTLKSDENTSWRVHPDAGDYEGGRTNPPVQRIDYGTKPARAVTRGTLTGIYRT